MTTNIDTVFRVKITGTRSLMLSNVAAMMAPPEVAQRLADLSGKKKLTLADEEERRRLKFSLACYWSEGVGFYVPGHNLWAAGKAAAKIHRLGPKWIQGVQIIEDKLPLVFDGPRTIEALYADRRFVDVRIGVLNGRSRIEAVRPIFAPPWSLEGPSPSMTISSTSPT